MIVMILLVYLGHLIFLRVSSFGLLQISVWSRKTCFMLLKLGTSEKCGASLS